MADEVTISEPPRVCGICESLIKDPTIIPICGHGFCGQCLCTHFTKQKEEVCGFFTCPACSLDVDWTCEEIAEWINTFHSGKAYQNGTFGIGAQLNEESVEDRRREGSDFTKQNEGSIDQNKDRDIDDEDEEGGNGKGSGCSGPGQQNLDIRSIYAPAISYEDNKDIEEADNNSNQTIAINRPAGGEGTFVEKKNGSNSENEYTMGGIARVEEITCEFNEPLPDTANDKGNIDENENHTKIANESTKAAFPKSKCPLNEENVGTEKPDISSYVQNVQEEDNLTKPDRDAEMEEDDKNINGLSSNYENDGTEGKDDTLVDAETGKSKKINEEIQDHVNDSTACQDIDMDEEDEDPSLFQKVNDYSITLTKHCSPTFTGLAPLNDEFLILCDNCGHHDSCGYVCLFNIELGYVTKIKLDKPFSVCVLASNVPRVAVSVPNDNAIHVLSIDGEWMMKEMVFETKQKPLSLVGLQNGRLGITWCCPPSFEVVEIGEAEMKSVMLYTRDTTGRRFKSFRYVAVDEARSHIIQPCHEDNAVYCFNFTGKPVFTYRDPRLIGPYGVDIDGTGNIYICSRLNDTVHILDPVGSKLRIISENIPSCPQTIKFDRSREKFWITAFDRYDLVGLYALNDK